MSRIIVDESYCKGCGLCVDACPEGIVALADDRINEKGYHPAILTNEAACTACSSCATMCSDVAITVVRSR